jgi:hypothetical protein
MCQKEHKVLFVLEYAATSSSRVESMWPYLYSLESVDTE